MDSIATPATIVAPPELAGDRSGEDAPDLLPVRMLNEFVYCPRLFHLMYVEGRWEDNVYTIEGKDAHRRVDKLDHVLPDPETADVKESAKEPPDTDGGGDERPTSTRSVTLGSTRLGIVARLDLVSTAGDEAVPVDTKRGRVPNNPERSWEPERVQLMAQGLLLREHGYRCDHGVLYYEGSKTRVDVPFTPELEARTLRYIEAARTAARSTVLPDPLEDSPKCSGCSLNAICLPDETLALRHVPPDPTTTGHPPIRRLYPARDEALPLYVQEQGAMVGKRGEMLVIEKAGEELARVRLRDVSQLVLCGRVGITAAAIHLLCEAAVPIVHLSAGHWFYGITHGITLRNAFDRAAQFRAAADPGRVLEFARAIIAAKGANQRTLLNRNAQPKPAGAIERMATFLRKLEHASSVDEILGLEGNLASLYFQNFSAMLRPRDFDAEWAFQERNRRPPRDPVNALLSFGYALLTKECTVALLAEGLDPWWGLFHQPRHGRPALALDLMEEFRPLIVDSAVITAVNTGMVTAGDFLRSGAACVLTASGRKAFLKAYEARLNQLVTHPVFDYRCSWRQVIRLQARLLSRWLRGDVPVYLGITTR